MPSSKNDRIYATGTFRSCPRLQDHMGNSSQPRFPVSLWLTPRHGQRTFELPVRRNISLMAYWSRIARGACRKSLPGVQHQLDRQTSVREDRRVASSGRDAGQAIARPVHTLESTVPQACLPALVSPL